ncbi:uncharacterized protein LOC143282840 isoform X2 [Babylonia areolata]|uniref:uncharacterized protein LOC143282840 isoform X2 n=1 Tax=Babylonia areolata TaxID=304850 RepID=UPI003FD1F833
MGKCGVGWILLATIFFLDPVCGLQWENKPADVVYACAGSKVTLPWRFEVTKNEAVTGVSWIHDGALSSSLMASMVHDHFLATGDYSARVRHVQNGGLVVKDLVAEDTGNYSIEVSVVAEGLFRSYQQTVTVQVGDGPMVKGDLRADQDPQARWDEASQEWNIRLTCGSFTFLGPPPVDVVWTTPDGDSKASSGYETGHFYLSLLTPVRGGNYTCSIPEIRFPDICNRQHGGHFMALSASVGVDEVKARLSLLEANQEKLLADNAHLQDRLRNVEQAHASDMQNASQYFRGMVTSLGDQIDDMKILYIKTADLEHKIAALSGPCNPRSHVEIDDAWRSVDQGSGSNCDKNLNPGWYRFFLHGENAVIPTTCVPRSHCGTVATMWLDLQGQSLPDVGDEVTARACAHWTSGCCRTESPITVRNCGLYFVYKLNPAPNCNQAFCVEPRK